MSVALHAPSINVRFASVPYDYKTSKNKRLRYHVLSAGSSNINKGRETVKRVTEKATLYKCETEHNP